eukprot:756732-Hanusia_phi.AAC.1
MDKGNTKGTRKTRWQIGADNGQTGWLKNLASSGRLRPTDMKPDAIFVKIEERRGVLACRRLQVELNEILQSQLLHDHLHVVANEKLRREDLHVPSRGRGKKIIAAQGQPQRAHKAQVALQPRKRLHPLQGARQERDYHAVGQPDEQDVGVEGEHHGANPSHTDRSRAGLVEIRGDQGLVLRAVHEDVAEATERDNVPGLEGGMGNAP